MATLPSSALPPVTEQDRRAAFAAFAWAGWSYEQAMAQDTRRRCIETRAAQLRKAQWQATRRRVVRPATPLTPPAGHVRDCKRLAAGDLDD